MSFPTRPLRKEASVKKEQQNENVKEKQQLEQQQRRTRKRRQTTKDEISKYRNISKNRSSVKLLKSCISKDLGSRGENGVQSACIRNLPRPSRKLLMNQQFGLHSKDEATSYTTRRYGVVRLGCCLVTKNSRISLLFRAPRILGSVTRPGRVTLES